MVLDWLREVHEGATATGCGKCLSHEKLLVGGQQGSALGFSGQFTSR